LDDYVGRLENEKEINVVARRITVAKWRILFTMLPAKNHNDTFEFVAVI